MTTQMKVCGQSASMPVHAPTYWTVKYEGQAASWIVINRSRRRMLRDYFGAKADAQKAADALNKGKPLP